jgi:arginyl-tRNA--protein-N-Asp/Glu arginylyltransferase
MSTAAEASTVNESRSTNDLGKSIAEVFGSDASKCGYCHSEGSSRSFGVWFHRLHPEDYQNMLDAGWRRSGHYLYRPDLERSCCQAFAIRLKASSYVPSSGQNRVLKRLHRATAPSVEPFQRAEKLLPHKSSLEPRGTTSLDAGDARSGHPKSGFIAESCIKLTALVLDAISQLTKPNHLGVSIASAVFDASKCAISVRFRQDQRKLLTKDVMQWTSSTSGSETPELSEATTNAAMIISANERKLAQHGGCRPERKIVLERQMQIGNAIATLLDEEADPRHGIASASCARPGWINLMIQSDHIGKSGPRAGTADQPLNSSVVGSPRKLRSHDEPLLAAGDSACSPNKRPRSDGQSSRAGLETGCISKAVASSTPLLDEIYEDRCECRGTPISDEGAESLEEMSELWLRNGGASVNDTGQGPTPQKANLQAVPTGRSFAIEFAPSSFVEDEFELYKRYQMSVHGDTLSDCEEHRYRRFLVDSPLVAKRLSNGRSGPPQGFGSFHARYTLDGQLFAVGVVDILPKCLSSVYLFFDPDFATLSPGVLSAVKEIEWVRDITHTVPEIEYYYMGYYIHTCPKMKYKAAFKPSEIMCEETRHWVPVERAGAVLNEARSVRLAPSGVPLSRAATNHIIPEEELSELVDRVIVLVDKDRVVRYGAVERAVRARCGEESLAHIRHNLGEFIRLVGRSHFQAFIHSIRI